MRHLKRGKKFHRTAGKRRALLRNLAANLIRDGKIETTVSRAKALRPAVERLVTVAKRGDLASRRLLIRRLKSVRAARRLMEELGPRYGTRQGGYLRITKLTKSRKRDGAPLARIEFVE
jgi:large subunit ribosomal protein L17